MGAASLTAAGFATDAEEGAKIVLTTAGLAADIEEGARTGDGAARYGSVVLGAGAGS